MQPEKKLDTQEMLAVEAQRGLTKRITTLPHRMTETGITAALDGTLSSISDAVSDAARERFEAKKSQEAKSIR